MDRESIKNLDFEETSRNLGLNPLQARIIINLLQEDGEATAPQLIRKISRVQKVNRTSVYLALDLLEENGLVSSTIGTKKTKSYALVSTSPEKIVETLQKPQRMAITSFLKHLKLAKEQQRKKNLELSGYYTLKGRKKIIEQLKTLIRESRVYILIQANSNMLELIYPFLEEKKMQSPEVEILIQITWNPKTNLDINQIKKKYSSLLGLNRIALPHRLYSDIFSALITADFDNYPRDVINSYREATKNVHFVHVLTDQGSVLGTFFGLKWDLGGGYFTRDPFTTQVHHINFFVIFESSLDQPFDSNLREKILMTRILRNFDQINLRRKNEE